jgi:hypothetical protein
MTIPVASALEHLPAVVFQFAGRKLDLLNGEPAAYPQLTPAKLAKIIRGEWRKLVPEEFHPVVQKLSTISKAPGHATVEFPVYWMGNTIWMRIFAAAVAEQKGKPMLIGLAQDVTAQRHTPCETELTLDDEEDPWKKLRHEINSSLTSIIMNCELLLGCRDNAELHEKIGGVLSEALRIDQLLHHYRG